MRIEKRTIGSLICLFITYAIICIALTGCNTMGGAGRDIESVGESIQDAAD